MTPRDFSPALRALIADHINSVAQLQTLLLLHGQPARMWSAAELAAELRVSPQWVQDQLSVLEGLRFATLSGGGVVFTGDEGVGAVVAELAAAYARFPDAVVTLIYSKPSRALHNFADAFRLRKSEGPSDG